MSKRRDKKGRVLRNGESQRADGRYVYSYVDLNGKPKCVYSWKLEETDSIPVGKRKCVALREKAKKIQRDMEDGLIPYGGQLTVIELVKKYISQKTGVRRTTRAGYKTVINLLEKEDFGSQRIDRVKLIDARAWFVKLQQSDGKSFSSIHTIRGVLRPAFQMAVDSDLIRKNPFDFRLIEILVNDSVRREALSGEDQRRFLEFVKNDRHFSKYYEGIYILLHTGMRISEFCGLTIADIDLKEKTVNIDHQLQRVGDMEYIIVETKSESGTRILPMSDEVAACFQKILKKRPKYKTEPSIRAENGKVYKGFLYIDKNQKPMVALHWEKYFEHIIQKHNNIYKQELPKITPHICRHTYCSNMAKKGMNPKTLQYLMGHADVSITLNVYTHVKLSDVQEELERINRISYEKMS